LAKGVECESLDTNQFNVTNQMRSLLDGGGKIFAQAVLSQNPSIEWHCIMSHVNDERFV
jgi:hypothetical protein